jgi:hypothetical protein
MDSSDCLELAVNMGRAADAVDLSSDVILGAEVVVRKRAKEGS